MTTRAPGEIFVSARAPEIVSLIESRVGSPEARRFKVVDRDAESRYRR
jgi:hypothetical protein